MAEVEKYNVGEMEVLTELEFHQNMAIRHTEEADRHMALSIEEYIAAGEHLIEVKARIPGEFERWVENEYRRSLTQARAYMRVARNKNTILSHRSTDGLTLKAAIQYLAPPKEEPEPELEEVIPPEPVVEQDEIEQELDTARIEEEIQRLREEVAEQKKTRREQGKKIQEEKRRTKELEEALTLRQERAEEAIRKAVADVYVKYGLEPEEVTIGSMIDDHREALRVVDIRPYVRESRGERMRKAAEVGVHILGNSHIGIEEYSPQEVADALMDSQLNWQDPRDLYTNLEPVRDWINEFSDVLDQATRPGVRSIK
jgi:hypothetical protein